MNDNGGMGKKWLPPLLTFVFWCLLGAGIAFWLLHWFGNRSAAAPDYARTAGEEVRVLRSSAQGLTAALGGRHFAAAAPASEAAATPASQSASVGQPIDPKRFRIGGILAQNPGSDGLVLLAVDGEPAKLFSKGETVTDGVVLHSLTRTTAALAADAKAAEPEVTLEIGKSDTSGSASADGGAAVGSGAPTLESFFEAGGEGLEDEPGMDETTLTREEATRMAAEMAEMEAALMQQKAAVEGVAQPEAENAIPPEMQQLIKALESAAAGGNAPAAPAAVPPPRPLLLGQQPVAPVAAPPAQKGQSPVSQLQQAVEQEKARDAHGQDVQ